jgi:hypothetical protein
MLAQLTAFVYLIDLILIAAALLKYLGLLNL